MSTISKKIELYLKLQLNEAENQVIEIQRNSLADFFNCVPSQINYVLNTRFNLEQGYSIETRRGGGGFVRIRKIDLGLKDRLCTLQASYFENLQPDNMSSFIERLYEEEILTERERYLMKEVFNSRAFSRMNHQKSQQMKVEILQDLLKAIINL